MSVDGDKIIVGRKASAHVFHYNGVSWVQKQMLTPSDSTNFVFGDAVSISGDTVVIGSSNSAYVFRYNGSSWVEEQKLISSASNVISSFGNSVALSADTIVVGSENQSCVSGNKCGSAYVFNFNGSDWIEEYNLTSSDLSDGDRFGASVSVSGSTVIVGARGDILLPQCFNCGAAYMFDFSSNMAPVVTAHADLNVTEGDILSVEVASFLDDEEFANIATIDWGDGTITPGIVDQGADTVTGTHTYGDNSIYTVTVTVNDCNNANSDSFDITVNNKDPFISVGADRIVTVDDIVQLQSQSFDVLVDNEGVPTPYTVVAKTNMARFADLGFDMPEIPSTEDFIAEVDWGDGRGVQPTVVSVTPGRVGVPTTGTIQASTIFEDPGHHTVCVNIDDDDGGSATDCAIVTSVYDTCNVEQNLTASDAENSDTFGSSVSVSGDTLIVGASRVDCMAGAFCGAAYVYRFIGTTWVEQQILTASDAAGRDWFGVSVSLSGDAAIVGAYKDDCAAGFNCGSAYVFRFNGTSWVQEQILTASDAVQAQSFGSSVYVSGNTALVGAIFDDCTPLIKNCGAAYVFQYNGISWVEQQKLTASDAAADDWFGASVSLSGDAVIVGAYQDDCAACSKCGSAYMFRFNGTSWVEEQKLTASDADHLYNFGHSVSLSGDTAVVGATLSSCPAGGRCGATYVYQFDGTSWGQEQKLTGSDTSNNDRFGSSVSISMDTIAIGAELHDCSSVVYDCGSVYVFRLEGTSWVEKKKLIASDAGPADQLGISVAMSGDTIVAGAIYYDCRFARDCGSAYVFDLAKATDPALDDFNCDGEVNLYDFSFFQTQFNGDLYDYALFHANLIGPQ